MLLGTALMAQNTMNESLVGPKANRNQPMQKAMLHTTHKAAALIQEYDSIYTWNLDTATDMWVMPAGQKEVNFMYDANGNILSKVVMNWNGSAWANYFQTMATYNGNNEQTNYVTQNWNGSAFVNASQQYYTYDANHNRTGDDYEIWSGSAWHNTSRDTFGYDVNNNEIWEIYQNWNGSGWTNGSLYSYAFNSHNVISSDTTETWTGSAWTYVRLDNNTFDANYNYLTNTSQTWTGSAWLNSGLDHYSYDVSNNETADTTWQWSGSAWLPTTAYAYTFNVSNKETGYSYDSYIGSSWVKQAAIHLTWDANNFEQSFEARDFKNGGPKVSSGDSCYYYYHTVLGVNNIASNKSNISVYPNPSNGVFTMQVKSQELRTNSVEVYNVLGEKVYSQLNIQNQTFNIDLPSQPNGVYFYRVIANSGELIGEGRLVIQK